MTDGRSIRTGFVLSLVLPFLLLWATPASASDATYVERLQVSIAVHEDGDITLTETETHVFPSLGSHHGILRSIQVAAQYGESTTERRHYPLSDLSVSSPSGAPAQVQRVRDGEYEQLRIGDPDRTVTGTQVYEIGYTLGSVVNDGRVFEEIGAEHAELVYNVVGSANEQRYEVITVSVTGPAAAQQARCTAGAHGSDEPCDSAVAGSTTTFRHADLASGEGLTVSLQYPRSAFVDDLAPQVEKQSNALVGPAMIGAAVLLPLVGIPWAARRWWRQGRDEVYVGLTPGLLPPAGQEAETTVGSHGSFAVQFTPPEGVPPGLVGVIMDHRADTDDVTATIIDLAVKGHLTISEGKRGDWLLSRTSGEGTSALLPYEEALLSGLFSSGRQVSLSTLKDSFASTTAGVKTSMVQQGHELGWFREHPTLAGSGMGRFATLLSFGGAAMAFAGGQIPGTEPWSGAIPVASHVPLGIAMFATGFVIAGFTKHMVARSARGSALKAQAEGFKRYLETAEANQIRFEEATGLFSRYLPYAIIFGCADRWAKVFDEVADAARVAGATVDVPTWYVGRSVSRQASFRGMTKELNSFAVASGRTLTSTPSSSGSSSFRGGRGGGRVGGGGAGSTGGSW